MNFKKSFNRRKFIKFTSLGLFSAFLSLTNNLQSEEIETNKIIKISSIQNPKLKAKIISYKSSLKNDLQIDELINYELKMGYSFWYENELYAFSQVSI